MSTRSAIIAKTETGYRGIYCHFDGYKEGVGVTLKEHYTDPDKVRRLVNLGDISFLEKDVEPTGHHTFQSPQPGVTVAYMRDRGESDCGPTDGESLEEVASQIGHNGYVYVFENGEWTLNGESFEV